MSDRDAIIRVEEVSKRYGKVTAVERVTLESPRGQFFALHGPSG